MIYLADMLCEALDWEYTLMRRGASLRKLAMITVIDCKSLFDNSQSVCSSASGVTDKLTAVDVTIIREMSSDTGLEVKWAPGPLQLADGLTKNKEGPALRLRGAVRSGTFQLAEAGEHLRHMKEERELKELRKAEKKKEEPQPRKSSAETSGPVSRI